MSAPRSAPSPLRLSGFIAAEARAAGCSFETYVLAEARPVRYAGSRIDHHGPTWLVGTCDCEDCAFLPAACPPRHVLILPRKSTGELHALLHVRDSSFTPL